jgi:hypothetical protein
MDLWNKISTADSSLDKDTSRIVFINTALRGKLELMLFTTNRNVLYTAATYCRQGCSYICFCGIQNISHLQITVRTQQWANGPYILHDYQADYYENAIVNVSLHAQNCSPRADDLVSETLRLGTLQIRHISDALKFQVRNECPDSLRFRFPTARMTDIRTGVQTLSCSDPWKHGKSLDFHLDMNVESD